MIEQTKEIISSELWIFFTFSILTKTSTAIWCSFYSSSAYPQVPAKCVGKQMNFLVNTGTSVFMILVSLKQDVFFSYTIVNRSTANWILVSYSGKFMTSLFLNQLPGCRSHILLFFLVLKQNNFVFDFAITHPLSFNKIRVSKAE